MVQTLTAFQGGVRDGGALEHDSQEASLTVVGDLTVTCAIELGAIIPIMQMSKWRLRGQVT